MSDRKDRDAAEAATHRKRRDRFAAAALQGLLSHYGTAIINTADAANRSIAAVAFADALIAELDKEVTP